MYRTRIGLLVVVMVLTMMLAPAVADALVIPDIPFDQMKLLAMLNHETYAMPLYRLHKPQTVGTGSAINYEGTTITLDESHYSVNARQVAYYEARGFQKQIVAYVSPVPLVGLAQIQRYTVLDQYSSLSGFEGLYGGFPVAELLSIDLDEEPWEPCGYAAPLSLSEPAMVAVKQWRMIQPVTTLGGTYTERDYFYSAGQAGPYPEYHLVEAKFMAWPERTLLQKVTFGSLLDPVGGVSHSVSWQTLRGGGVVELLYSLDNGLNWTSIAAGVPNAARAGATNTYSWQVPNYPTTELRIMVKWSAVSRAEAAAWATSEKLTISRNPRLPALSTLPAAYSILSGKPARPTDLVAMAGAGTPAITLFWKDNASNETEYLLRLWEKDRQLATFGSASLPADTETYVHTGVSPNVEYVYEVIARGAVDSDRSNQVTAIYTPDGAISTRVTRMLVPTPPSALSAAAVPGTPPVVALRWSGSISGTIGYVIDRSADGVQWVTVRQVGPEVVSASDQRLPAIGSEGATFYYRVRAIGETTVSAPSNLATATFGGAAPVQPEPLPGAPSYDGSQSGWAEPELTRAFQNGLTYPGVLYEYQRKITRDEFCAIAVKLYERLTLRTAVPGDDPFEDTDNPDVLKAYALGIVRGVSETRFAPANNITRQEMCVMIYRALQAAGKNTLLTPGGSFPFSDAASIAPWAINEVRFCHQNEIMKGTSPTTISPLVNTPREQAIVLIQRTFEAFK